MLSLASLSLTLQTLFTTTAETIARETGCVRRRSKCTGALLCQTLVFGWLGKPDARLSELCHTAAIGGIRLSPQGLDQRFTPQTAACLRELLQHAVGAVVSADPVAIPLLQRFAGVWIEDCSIVSLPDALAELWRGCGGSGPAPRAALKLGVQFNLTDGSLRGPLLAAGRVHDRAVSDRQPVLPPGSLRITDLGFFGLERFARLDAAGVFILSRPQAGTIAYDEQDRRWDVADLLAAQGSATVDLPIRLGARARFPCRLLAVRVPLAVGAARRRAIRRDAKREGQTPSRSRLLLADWNAFVTTVPVEQLSVSEALVLARARWQIELLFKLWKTYGRLTHSRSSKPWRLLCELYAKLLALVVQHWIVLTAAWAYPDRSLPKLLATVRAWAMPLLDAIHRGRRLQAVLRCIRPCLRATAPINPRRTRPNTYQLLLNPPLGVLA